MNEHAQTQRVRAGHWFEVLLVICYAALVVTLVLNHEPWRDEADAWLVARDVGIPELFHLTPYLGTPGLWYLLLMPFAKFGCPYITLGLLNAAAAIGAVAVLAWRAPFSRLMKLGIASSCLVSFEYAAVARSYALSMLLLFAVVSLRADRASAPWWRGVFLALLANTNAHGLILAGALWMGAASERLGVRFSRSRAGLGELTLGALGGVAGLIQLRPVADGQILQPPGIGNALDVLKVTTHGAFFPMLVEGASTWAGVVVLALVAVALVRHRASLVFFLGAVLGLQVLFVTVWAGGLRHWGFLLLAAVAALWTASGDEEPAPGAGRCGGFWSGDLALRVGQVALAVSLPISVWTATTAWVGELRSPYSGAERMGRYIVASGLERMTIAADQAPHGSAVLPYLPVRQLWYPAMHAYGSYMTWDRELSLGMELSTEEVLSRIERTFGHGEDLLLLLSYPLIDPGRRGFEAVFATPPAAFTDETYYLYRRRQPPP